MEGLGVEKECRDLKSGALKGAAEVCGHCKVEVCMGKGSK